MVNDEILEGLKAALGRGESIEQAKLTFANAGYPQNDIEEAISSIQSEGKIQANPSVQTVPDKKQEQTAQQKVSEPENKKIEEPKSNPEKTEQKVSKYGEEKPKSKNVMIILLISILVLLLAGLAGMFLFKDQVMNLLSNLFD